MQRRQPRALESDRLGLKPNFLIRWLWVRFLNSLGLSDLICKMETRATPTSQGRCGVESSSYVCVYAGPWHVGSAAVMMLGQEYFQTSAQSRLSSGKLNRKMPTWATCLGNERLCTALEGCKDFFSLETRTYFLGSVRTKGPPHPFPPQRQCVYRREERLVSRSPSREEMGQIPRPPSISSESPNCRVPLLVFSHRTCC